MTRPRPGDPPPAARTLSRRDLLAAAGAAATVGLAGCGAARARRPGPAPRVFIARGQRYDGPLAATIADGLRAVGFEPARAAGRLVLLKPNLVEPDAAHPHITTHPAVILAVAEVLRRWGAQVFVGEGPGHVRDTEAILAESRVADPLGQAGLEFIDLNYEDTTWTPNAGRTSALDGFHLPRRAVASDWIVSMPKLKTHHWIGMTAAMKNLYGVLPGVVYGWPKNILHAMGIPQTVYDLTASLPEAITVIDAIDCMEGDGPIMGRPKPMGLIVIGTDLPAVDATCARIMGLVPERIDYLRLASDNGATLEADRIQLPGESWADVRSPFQILDYPHLSRLRDPDAPPIPAARPATGSAG